MSSERIDKMDAHQLTIYPLLHKTIATIVKQILAGLLENEPVHIGIENPNFFLNYRKYDRSALKDWEKHLSEYRVVYGSVGVSSIVVKLEYQIENDIFEEGTYFYNCKAGSLEIEVNPKGELSQISAEFNGSTPSFIPKLLEHFPEEAFPCLDELQKEISQVKIVKDELFLADLKPLPYEVITIE